jgi:hypothetical protein
LAFSGDNVSGRRDVDEGFWKRADAHIDLANTQCGSVSAGKVSASLLYAASRFNAFVVASQISSAAELRDRREEALEYFTREFRKGLEENLDDYIAHFEDYTKG